MDTSPENRRDDTSGTNNLNCVVELENRSFLQYKDLEFALIGADGDGFGVDGINSPPFDLNNNSHTEMTWKNSNELNDNSSLQMPLQNTDFSISDMSIIKAIESITEQKTSTPCMEQDNCTDSPFFKVLQDMSCDVSREIDGVDDNENKDSVKGNEENQMVYASLESISSSNCLNYETPKMGIYRQNAVPSNSNPTSRAAFVSYQTRPLYSRENIPFAMRSPYINARRRRPWKQTPLDGKSPFPNSSSSSATTGSSSGDYTYDTAQSSVSSGNIESGSGSSFCSETSPEIPKPPSNTPNSEDTSFSKQILRRVATNRVTQAQLASKLECLTRYPQNDLRESHNAKERKRRSRIRDACQAMRRLIPSVYDRTDNATVFEHLATYIQYLQMRTNNKFDFDYMQQRQLKIELCNPPKE